MKKALHITIALALSTVGWGQFSRVDYAEEMMLRWKYAEAYPVWAELAEEQATPDSLRWGYARNAAIAAYQANFIEEAMAWNDSLLFNPKPQRRIGFGPSNSCAQPTNTILCLWPCPWRAARFPMIRSCKAGASV